MRAANICIMQSQRLCTIIREIVINIQHDRKSFNYPGCFNLFIRTLKDWFIFSKLLQNQGVVGSSVIAPGHLDQ